MSEESKQDKFIAESQETSQDYEVKQRKPQRRKIIIQKTQETSPIIASDGAEIAPSIPTALSEGLGVIKTELHKFKLKSRSVAGNLNPTDAKTISNYMDILIKLNREAREASKSADLDNLSTEELVKLAKELKR